MQGTKQDNNLDQYWIEVSDLTIFEAAFWMQIGSDPRAHEYRCACGDTAYEVHFDDHPGGREAVHEKCLVIDSAAQAGKIRVTRDSRLKNNSFNFNRTHILKSDWLEWCSDNNYVELKKQFTNKTTGKTISSSSSSETDWRELARAIADECFDTDTENKCRDSLKGYSKRVMEKMQERMIHGPRGRIDNPSTVKREALQGEKWWANKKK